MKTYSKILVLLLCLSLLIGLVTISASAQAGNRTGTSDSPFKQGIFHKMVSPTRLDTTFGYYSDNTGNNSATFVDCGDGDCLTDGWYGRAGYAMCTSRDGLIAAIIDIDAPILFGGIEITANDKNGEGDGDLIDFDVQAWVDGEWVEVLSVNTWPHAAGRTVKYTFDAVKTSKVRMLIHKYYDKEPRLKEITLFEEQTGNMVNTIDLNGQIGESDAPETYPANNLIDGDKSSTVQFSDALIDVSTDGTAVAVDGFVLYPYRGNMNFPESVTISLLVANGAAFEPIGTYETGWRNTNVVDPLVVTFEQTYLITAIIVNVPFGFVNEFELFQFQRTVPLEPDPTEPPTKPTEPPTEATEPPTEATEPPTEPTEPPTEATEPPTEPTEPPTDSTEPPTDPTAPPTDPTAPPTDPTEPPTDPAGPPVEATDPSIQPTAAPSAPAEDPSAPAGSDEPGRVILLAVIGLLVVGGILCAAVIIKKKKKA